jgi:zinc D-Ala-D-Ala carboxypeptidase
MPTMLSPHFSLEELTHSDTAVARKINNMPDEGSDARNRLQALAEFLEKVRRICGGHTMHIHDAYRSPQLNAIIPGSSKTSAHPEGFAADFDVEGQTPYQTALLIDQAAKRGEIVFDQLILEQLPTPSWVHIGRRHISEDTAPRMERQTKDANGVYVPGLIKP